MFSFVSIIVFSAYKQTLHANTLIKTVSVVDIAPAKRNCEHLSMLEVTQIAKTFWLPTPMVFYVSVRSKLPSTATDSPGAH